MRTKVPLLVMGLSILLTTAGCRAKPTQVPPPPSPPPAQNLLVLLPESDEPGAAPKASRVVITNAAGSQELAKPYQAVRLVRSDVAPGAPFQIEESEVRRHFGALLDALPAAEAHFTLYFELDSDTLTADSLARVADILQAIRDRRSTDISIVGHTDTTGTPDSNSKLGLNRAQRTAEALRERGVDPAIVSVASHGQGDPLIKTAPGVDEPKNRRVEVIVR